MTGEHVHSEQHKQPGTFHIPRTRILEEDGHFWKYWKKKGTLQDSHQEAARAFRRLLAKGVIENEAKEAWQSCKTRDQETKFIMSTMSQSLAGEWAFDHQAPAVKDP